MNKDKACPRCVSRLEAVVDNAAHPLAIVQEGGFWEGFRYAQKALRDYRLSLEATTEQSPCWDRDVGRECVVCAHEHCGWCPECHPEVPEW